MVCSFLFRVGVGVLGLSLAAAGTADDAKPDAPLASLRLSALVQMPDGARAGIVDATGGREFWLAPGETENGLTLVSVDFKAEQATVRMDATEGVLRLAAGEGPTAENERIVESLSRFLQEFPDALETGLLKLPLDEPPPPVTGRGPGIEAFLREHAEAAALDSRPQTGRGEGIEGFLRSRAKGEPEADRIVPEGERGEGIENAVRQWEAEKKREEGGDE